MGKGVRVIAQPPFEGVAKPVYTTSMGFDVATRQLALQNNVDDLALATAKVSARQPILFSHTDLDGATSAIMALARLESRLQVTFVNSKNANLRVSSYVREHTKNGRFIITTDLALDSSTGELLNGYEGGRVVLDHHVTSVSLNEYAWALVDDTRCGALIAYDTFSPGVAYADLARVVDDYDRWVMKDSRSVRLNDLFTLLGSSRFVKRFLANPTITFSPSEILLLEIEAEAKERYTQRVGRTLVCKTLSSISGEIRAGFGWADNYVSDVAHAMLDAHALDVVVLISPLNDRVSVRSNERFDSAILAQAFGGGGHRQAAGFVLSKAPRDIRSLFQGPVEGFATALQQHLSSGASVTTLPIR